ncbi:MAG TPA: lytic transglycosylase domain-containing protein [Bacilli bacterium]|nr:lytic transglycosylase domain-containing protein [Bacilli bacterium]
MIWPRISWALSAKAKRKILLLGGLLLLVVLLVSSNWFWRWLYPIHHEEAIQQAAAAHEIDPLLIAAIIRVESKFEQENVSHVGAIGLMQLMPNTAEWIAQQTNIPYRGAQDLAQPETNIKMGAWYIAFLSEQFGGDQAAVIAAYNAGPGRVSQWIEEKKWDGRLETADRIPVGETRHYVQRVFYNYEKYKQLYPDFGDTY